MPVVDFLSRPRPGRSLSASFVLSIATVAGMAAALGARPALVIGADEPREHVLTLQGTTGEPVRISESEFKKLPHVEVEAVDHGGKKVRYSGVPLRVLLDKVGVPSGEKLRGRWMGAYVAVDALDDYRAVYALGELDPWLSERTIILADTRDGKPLDKRHAPFQVVAPGEKRPARWVFMVREIRVFDSRAKEK
jgi:hypothetical protein